MGRFTKLGRKFGVGKRKVSLFGIGMFMGVADLVPGVSGGTIAFIFGIYEELLYAIKTLTGEFLSLLFRGRVVKAYKLVPFGFLLPVLTGIVVSVLVFASGLEYLLSHAPLYLWAFFFGLVLASTRLVMKRIVKWSRYEVAAFAFFGLLAFVVVGFSAGETSSAWWMFVLSGAVAICAMILPGISGSFILVLLGKYSQVLQAVVDLDFKTLFTFGIGAVLGISVFARFLRWLFYRHHDLAVAALSGIMLGSLRRIWPWQLVTETDYSLLFPSLNPQTLFALLLGVVGFYVMHILARKGAAKERMGDITNAEFTREHGQAIKLEKQKTEV